MTTGNDVPTVGVEAAVRKLERKTEENHAESPERQSQKLTVPSANGGVEGGEGEGTGGSGGGEGREGEGMEMLSRRTAWKICSRS